MVLTHQRCRRNTPPAKDGRR